MITEHVLPRMTCKDCTHTWILRTARPKRCPRCQKPLAMPPEAPKTLLEVFSRGEPQ